MKNYLLIPVFCTLTCFMMAQPTYPSEVWKNLDKTVGNATVVAFGESSHRLVGLHEFANEMFKYLVEKKGFRVFVLETMWELENAVNEYIQSDSSKMDFKQSFYLNAFQSESTLKMIDWVKAWNRSHPQDPITISGYQPEQPVSDCREIKKYFAQVGMSLPDSVSTALQQFPFFNGQFKHDLDAVTYFGKKRRAKQPAFNPAEKETLRRALNGLQQYVNTQKDILIAKSDPIAYQGLNAHILSLRGYLFGILYYADPTNFSGAACGDELKNAESMVRNIYSEGDGGQTRQAHHGQQRFKKLVHLEASSRISLVSWSYSPFARRT